MIKKYTIGAVWVVALIAEWILDMTSKIVSVVHEGWKDMTLALEKIKNEPDSRKIQN